MKLCSLLFTTVIVATFAGCCGTNACVNSCDPCGRELAGGGCPLKRLFKHRCDKCHPMATYGWEGAACGSCQGHPGSVYTTAPAATTCSCGQVHNSLIPAPAATSAPASQAAPLPAPSAPPVPPTYEQPVPPAPPAPAPQEEATAIPTGSTTSNPQQVSYEEFQRLPGVVISGPTPAPALPPTLVPPKSAAQAANWVPTR